MLEMARLIYNKAPGGAARHANKLADCHLYMGDIMAEEVRVRSGGCGGACCFVGAALLLLLLVQLFVMRCSPPPLLYTPNTNQPTMPPHTHTLQEKAAEAVAEYDTALALLGQVEGGLDAHQRRWGVPGRRMSVFVPCGTHKAVVAPLPPPLSLTTAASAAHHAPTLHYANARAPTRAHQRAQGRGAAVQARHGA
jgi:hypothetical protein